MKKTLATLALICTLGIALPSYAQVNELGQDAKNYISTGMPILMIAPDAVSSALGDAGAAYTPNAYSAHWNNAKFAFVEEDMSISTTYTPWLRKLGVGDMNLLYLGAFKRINNRSAAAASITYFSMGNIEGTDELGNLTQEFHPNEYAIDATYSMKLSDNMSLGATGRFIRSDLTNGMSISDGSGYTSTQAANALAADVGLYFRQPIDQQSTIAIGALISNLGNKLSYSKDQTGDEEFLPANLRIGGYYTYEIDDYNDLGIILDFNKLLVPTPPISEGQGTYSDYYPNMQAYQQTSVMSGVFNSFFDAPGGTREELHEISISAGAEYWYDKTFAFRAGYFFEHATKGGRQYATVGFGIRYNVIRCDFSYLIPTTQFSTNPLANTIRISLTMDLGNS